MDTTTGQLAPQIPGLVAGEDLDPVAPCYIGANFKVFMSNGAAANEAASFDGFTPKEYKTGEPVTLFGVGTRFKYADGTLTPGTLYIGATKGRLDTAATTGDTKGVARVIDASDIRVIRNG
jgi:hypothetical protein